MKLTYLGQCGFLLEGAGTRIVTDPYLSDYVDRHCCTGRLRWKRLYPPTVTLWDLHPDGILISHEHEDHMDPDTLSAYYAMGGTAPAVAPAPVAHQLVDMGVKNFRFARAGETMVIGGAKIYPVPCAHTELHVDEDDQYYELSYFIDFGEDGSVFFGGDMSLCNGIDEMVAALKPDLLLLPANGRDDIRAAKGIVGNMTAAEAAEFSAKLNIPWIPMHHDLYAENRCEPDEPQRRSDEFGAKLISLAPMESYVFEKGVKL